MSAPEVAESPAVSVRGAMLAVIVNYRTPELVADCLRSLQGERRDFEALHVAVVDGGSGDDSSARIAASIEALGAGHWATLMPLAINGGFGYANNQAILEFEAQGALPETIALVNPDAAVRPGALARLYDRMQSSPRIAAVGAQLENEEGEALQSAFAFPSVRGEFLYASRTGVLRKLLRGSHSAIAPDRAGRVDWITGAAMLLRKAALAEVGLFNDRFFLYFEETELCKRLERAGWEIWTEPAARVLHLGGRSTKLRDAKTGGRLLRRMPRYWFESRRRYFVLAHGPLVAVAAGASWLLGHAVWLLRCAVTFRRNDQPRHLGWDMLTIVLIPRRGDAGPPPSLTSPRGTTPAWIDAR